MSVDRLEDHLQHCWDQGRDPVDDPSVRTCLSNDPDGLERFARWRQSVAALRSMPPRRGRTWPWLLVAALLLCWSSVEVFAGGAPDLPELPGGRLLSGTMRVESRAPGAVATWSERTVLMATSHTRFEITELRSIPR